MNAEHFSTVEAQPGAGLMTNYLTRPEESSLLKQARQVDSWIAKRDAAWMGFMIRTGIRVQTMTLITVAMAEQAIRDKEIKLPAQIMKGKKKSHRVFLGQRALRDLKTLLHLRKQVVASRHPSGFLLVSRRTRHSGGQQPLSVRTLQHAFRKWADKAGVPKEVTLHGLRHTKGRRIMDESTASDPQKLVQLALGHSHRQTSDVYTKPTREQMAKVMEDTE